MNKIRTILFALVVMIFGVASMASAHSSADDDWNNASLEVEVTGRMAEQVTFEVASATLTIDPAINPGAVFSFWIRVTNTTGDRAIVVRGHDGVNAQGFTGVTYGSGDVTIAANGTADLRWDVIVPNDADHPGALGQAFEATVKITGEGVLSANYNGILLH